MGVGEVCGCGGGNVRSWAFVAFPSLDDPVDPGKAMDLVVPFSHLGCDVGETGVGDNGEVGGRCDVEDVFLWLAADGIAPDVHYRPSGFVLPEKRAHLTWARMPRLQKSGVWLAVST